MEKRNPYLVQLTAQDPFNIDGGKTQNKIYVSYSNNDEKAAGDIIFSLVDVEDTAQQREKYVSTKQLENTGFDPMKMVADVTERTIKLNSVTRLEDAKQPVTIATSTKEAAGDIIELWKKTDVDADFVKVNAYSSYAKALRAINAGDPATTYKLVNRVLAEFTEEDQRALLEDRQAKELIFEGDPNMMQFKNLKCITLPADRGYGITFNQPVAAMAQNNTKDSFEFYNNGGPDPGQRE